MKPKAKTKVFVSVLSGSAQCNASLLAMANQLPYIGAAPNTPWDFGFDITAGVRPQELARNQIIGKFLETDSEVLLMIDDDMVWRGMKTLEVLNTPDYDIAGPVQMMFRYPDPPDRPLAEIYTCAFIRDKDADMKIKPVFPGGPNVVIDVDAVGSGCMAIKRRVLEDSRMLLQEGMDPPAFFRNVYESNGNRTCGLDVDLCFRAKELGYRVRVNFNAEMGHFKRFDVNTAEMYAKSQFVIGYEAGTKDGGNGAIQVDEDKDGSAGGDGGSPRSEQMADAHVAGIRVDSPSPAEAGTGAAQKG